MTTYHIRAGGSDDVVVRLIFEFVRRGGGVGGMRACVCPGGLLTAGGGLFLSLGIAGFKAAGK
jgi:hypothetical protein